MSTSPGHFAITPQKRKSGAKFWLVRGTLDGRQKKKEFSRDRHAQAVAFAQEMNGKRLGLKPSEELRPTRLTQEDLDQAETVLLQLKVDFPKIDLLELLNYYRALSRTFTREEAQRIGPAIGRLRTKYPDIDIAAASDWFVANYRPPVSDITFGDAIKFYLKEVNRRRKRAKRPLSKPQYDRIFNAMAELQAPKVPETAARKAVFHFDKDEPLSHVTTPRLHEFLVETTRGRVIGKDKKGENIYGEHSDKTWDNRRGYLSGLFEYCRGEHWLPSNPASEIKSYGNHGASETPPALTPVEARDLMHAVEGFQGGRLVPFYALCLFAGIRPDWFHGEITKIKAEFFLPAMNELILPPEATKTRVGRAISIQPNLAFWLRSYPLNENPIIFKGFQRVNMKMRRHLKLKHDVLRHTFISMHVAAFRSMAETALQAGNSESVIKKSYYRLFNRDQSIEFWSILPKNTLPRVAKEIADEVRAKILRRPS
jgi:hypothetical protein